MRVCTIRLAAAHLMCRLPAEGRNARCGGAPSGDSARPGDACQGIQPLARGLAATSFPKPSSWRCTMNVSSSRQAWTSRGGKPSGCGMAMRKESTTPSVMGCGAMVIDTPKLLWGGSGSAGKLTGKIACVSCVCLCACAYRVCACMCLQTDTHGTPQSRLPARTPTLARERCGQRGS